MSVTASYTLSIDWNNDGDFGDAGEDVSDDLMDAMIRRGFNDPLARVAGVGRATFTLLNVDKTYSPPSASSVVPRRPIKFDMSYSGTSATLFRGFVEDIDATYGIYGERQATLRCVDSMRLLDRYEGEIALQTDTYADDIISAVVSAVYTPSSSSYQDGINYFLQESGRQHLQLHRGDMLPAHRRDGQRGAGPHQPKRSAHRRGE